MSVNFRELEYCLPAWVLTVLFDGDETGISLFESAELEAFLKRENLDNGHWSYNSDNEVHFAHRNDMNSIGGSVVDISFMQVIKG